MSPSFTGWLFWRWNTAITLPSVSRTVVGRASGCRLGQLDRRALPAVGGTPDARRHAHDDGAEQQRRRQRRRARVERSRSPTRIGTTLTAGPATFGSPSRRSPATCRDRYVAGRDRALGVRSASACSSVAAAPTPPAGWTTARKLEDLGYATATMPDHFTDQLAPVPALTGGRRRHRPRCGSARSCSTTTTGTRSCSPRSWRRWTCCRAGAWRSGSGPGGWRATTSSRGSPSTAPGVRIDRFEEAIAVIRGVMADGPFSFAGRHYTVSDYDGAPKPVQRPHPPLLIGGGGTAGAVDRRPRGRHRRHQRDDGRRRDRAGRPRHDDLRRGRRAGGARRASAPATASTTSS